MSESLGELMGRLAVEQEARQLRSTQQRKDELGRINSDVRRLGRGMKILSEAAALGLAQIPTLRRRDRELMLALLGQANDPGDLDPAEIASGILAILARKGAVDAAPINSGRSRGGQTRGAQISKQDQRESLLPLIRKEAARRKGKPAPFIAKALVQLRGLATHFDGETLQTRTRQLLDFRRRIKAQTGEDIFNV